MRRALVIALAAVLATGGATIVVLLRSDDDEPGVGGDEPRPTAEIVLVAGRADTLVVAPTRLDPLATPLTIEATERGAASARITPVLVAGREESVAWPGGTPLEIQSAGAEAGRVTLDPTPAEAGPDGLTVLLGGVAGKLAPGSYRLGGPVAVGAEGLARPADGITFEATEETTVSFEGSAVVKLPAEAVTLEGPGEVRVVGDVEVTTADVDRRVDVLEFGPGPYRFDLVWAGDRLEIEGRLEGEVRMPPARSTP